LVMKVCCVGYRPWALEIYESIKDNDYEVLIISSKKEYDEQKIVLKQRGLKSHSEAALFVCGSGKIAGSSLRVLEALESWETTIFYIVPDLEFASREEKRRHRAHFGILQEYARSGKVKEMVILSNEKIISIVGCGTALNYYEKVNFFIYSTIQSIMYCRHVKPEFGNIKERREISRISTIGLGTLDKEEQTLFPLANVTESMFLMNIEEEDLNSDVDIIPNCQQIVRKAKLENRDASFAIWKSSEANHFYSLHYTHFIQEPK